MTRPAAKHHNSLQAARAMGAQPLKRKQQQQQHKDDKRISSNHHRLN
jgi:hypothetical protein